MAVENTKEEFNDSPCRKGIAPNCVFIRGVIIRTCWLTAHVTDSICSPLTTNTLICFASKGKEFMKKKKAPSTICPFKKSGG